MKKEYPEDDGGDYIGKEGVDDKKVIRHKNKCPHHAGGGCVYKMGVGCQAPDPWEEFLEAEGGRGQSLDELRAMFAKEKELDMPTQIKRACKRARKMGRDRDRTVGGLYAINNENSCHAFEVKREIDRNPNKQAIRDKILYEMSETGETSLRIPLNFSGDELTVPKIERMLLLIDQYYWYYSLLETLPIAAINIHPEMIPHAPYALMVTAIKPLKDPNKVNVYGQRISHLFLDISLEMLLISGEWRADGILARNRLERLLIALCHETIHMYMGNHCYHDATLADDGDPSSRGHNITFRRLNHQIYGHSINKFQYQRAHVEVVE